MGTEYKYRKHIYWGQYVIPIFFTLLFLFLLGLSIFFVSRSYSIFLTIFLAILALVVLVEGAFIWYFYYNLAGNSILISDDMLIHRNRKGEKRYPLESIYLEFSSVKYVGGWLNIKTDQGAIRLTVVFENISGFLQELKTKLDNKNLQNHYDSHRLFDFTKTALASEQNWERLYAISGKMLLLILDISISLFTGYVLGIIPLFGFALVIGWAIVSMIGITIAYTVAEVTLTRQIAQKSNETNFTFPDRDLPYEKLVLDKIFTWGSIAYIALSSFIIVSVIVIRFIFRF